MDLNELVLRSIIRIRKTQPPQEINTLISAFGANVIRVLFKELGIESARAYLFSKNGGVLEYRKVIGEQEIWQRFEDQEVIDRRMANGFYCFPLMVRDALNRKRRNVVGYVTSYRKEKLAGDEYSAITVVFDFLGDYIGNAILNDRSSKTYTMVRLIEKIAETRALPGTSITKTQYEMHRLQSAIFSLFSVYADGKLYPEYLKNRYVSNPIIVKSPPISCPEDFASLIDKGDFGSFDSGTNAFLDEIVSRMNRGQKNNMTIYFSVGRKEGDAIALWLFCVMKNVLHVSREISDMFELANRINGQKYVYLYQRRTKKMVVSPHFISRDTKIEAKTAFILMPFRESWSDRIWQKIVKPTMDAIGYSTMRADDLYGHDIMEDIWKRINKSSIIIADITGRNPNVFYELGIAHCIGKDVILLTQSVADIPFDLNRYRHIVYQDNLDGYDLLKSGLVNTVHEIETSRL